MATLVVNLSDLKEKDKFFLLDTPLLPSGLSSVMLLTLSSSLRDLQGLWSWELATEFVETILHSRASSMRKLYCPDTLHQVLRCCSHSCFPMISHLTGMCQYSKVHIFIGIASLFSDTCLLTFSENQGYSLNPRCSSCVIY